MAPNQELLEVKNLYKSYGSIQAVRGISFTVQQGECFGLLGPNGAGKSTTIEMIEQIIRPDSGSLQYKGKPIDRRFLEEFGAQFQTTALFPYLTVRETIETYSRLYEKRIAVDDLIELCQLKSFSHQRHEKISGGQRQRLLLAVAMCHDGEFMLLDEPTTGLDPQSRRHVWEIIYSLKKAGKTILLTTHYMEEAFQLCDNIAIIDHGKIISTGNPRRLLDDFSTQVIVRLPKDNLTPQDLNVVRKIDGNLEEGLFFDFPTNDLNHLCAFFINHKIDLNKMTVRKKNFEDLFIYLTGKDLRD